MFLIQLYGFIVFLKGFTCFHFFFLKVFRTSGDDFLNGFLGFSRVLW